MTKLVATFAYSLLLAASLRPAPVLAQDVPTDHTPGCGGIICNADDRRRDAPPPPCTGLICGMTPYGMDQPVTAAEAKRIEEEQRARAAAAVPPKEEPKKADRKRKPKVAKAKPIKLAKKTVAAKTPDPGSTASPGTK